MKYPKSISSKSDEVEAIISSWPKKISLDDVMNWILQFDSDDYDLALRVIRNLNVIGYEDLSSALLVAYSKLMRKAIEKDARINSKNTLFAGIGDAGKSGSMMSYHFRLINDGISEENFLDDESFQYLERGLIENIVLIDDILSTGYQASEEIRKLTDTVTPLGVKNIFLLTACGMREGIQRVEDETKAYTFSAFEYDGSDTVISLDSDFYEGIAYDARENLRKRLEYYGGICSRKNPLGYGRIGALFVFYYNTPNTTLPIIWSAQNRWIPLFKRIPRINGIASYYSQFEKALKDKSATPTTESTHSEESNELSIFVEGKTDEMFFDIISKELDLAQQLGFRKIDVISLGGSVYSDRLLTILTEMKKLALFILDSDARRYARRTIEQVPNRIHYILLQPSIFEFIDIARILRSDEVIAYFPRILEFAKLDEHGDFPPEAILAFESAPFQSMPISKREKFLRIIIPQYLLFEKLGDFISRARTELSRPLETQETAQT